MADIDPLVTQQNAGAPALSATSDAPVITPAAPEPASEPDPAPDPTVAAEPEPTGEPQLESEPEPSADEKPPARPRTPFGERLSEVTQQRRRAEERADRLAESLERALTALNRATATSAKPADITPAPIPAAEPRPTREAFDTPEAYDGALIEWSTKQATRLAQAEFERNATAQREADERAAAERRQREQFDRAREVWAERKAKAIERMPDYVDVAERDDVPISTSMALIIQGAEQGPEIAYHLGKHPEEAARIAAMVVPGQFFPEGHPAAGEPLPDVQRQLYELGRIAAMATVPRAETTRAPRPITPLGSNGAARAKSPAEMTTEEYAAYRMPQLQAERKAGMLGIPAGQAAPPRH